MEDSPEVWERMRPLSVHCTTKGSGFWWHIEVIVGKELAFREAKKMKKLQKREMKEDWMFIVTANYYKAALISAEKWFEQKELKNLVCLGIFKLMRQQQKIFKAKCSFSSKR